jgi:hypothetical protein
MAQQYAIVKVLDAATAAAIYADGGQAAGMIAPTPTLSSNDLPPATLSGSWTLPENSGSWSTDDNLAPPPDLGGAIIQQGYSVDVATALTAAIGGAQSFGTVSQHGSNTDAGTGVGVCGSLLQITIENSLTVGPDWSTGALLFPAASPTVAALSSPGTTHHGRLRDRLRVRSDRECGQFHHD